MGIQINGATDSITAIDGTIDVVSAIGNAGVLTATAFVGNITGNVTGNINHTSNLELQTGGVTRAHFNSSGHFNVAGITTLGQTTIAHPTSPQLIIKDSDTNSPGDLVGVSFRAANNTEYGFIGSPDATGHTLFIRTVNTVNPIRLQVNSSTRLEVGNTGVYVSSTPFYVNGGNSANFSGDVNIVDSIIHTGDTNTKIRFPAADTITAETSGAERLRITSGGDVGINVTPISGVKLQVGTPGSATGVFRAHPDYFSIDSGHSYGGGGSGAVGSASNPSLIFGGDGNTGLYHSASDTLNFTTGGTERLRITDAASTFQNKLIIDDGSNGHLFLNNTSSENTIHSGTTGFAAYKNLVINAAQHIFKVSNVEKLRIDSSGRVGVNQSSFATSDTMFSVSETTGHCEIGIISKNDSGVVINMGDTDSYNQGRIKYDNSDNSLTFRTSATDRLRITSGGHVNIGGSYTQTSKRLYVDGSAEFTSNLTCVNQIYLNGTAPQIVFTDTNQDSDYTIKNDFGSLQFIDRTNSNAVRMYANTGGFGGDRLYIANDIVHTGDTDTKIAFTDNTIVVTAGNSSKMNINNTMVEINGSMQRQGGRTYSTNSTSTWQTIFSFSNATTNGFFFECAVSENNYSTIYKVGGSPNWNSCYFTSDHAGDSNHAHSSDITFRILNDSGTKRLQFKAVSYTTTRYLYAINVWVRSGYVNWS